MKAKLWNESIKDLTMMKIPGLEALCTMKFPTIRALLITTAHVMEENPTQASLKFGKFVPQNEGRGVHLLELLMSTYLDLHPPGLEPVYDLPGLHAGFAAEISDLGLVGVGTFLERPVTPAVMRSQTERKLRLEEMECMIGGAYASSARIRRVPQRWPSMATCRVPTSLKLARSHWPEETTGGGGGGGGGGGRKRDLGARLCDLRLALAPICTRRIGNANATQSYASPSNLVSICCFSHRSETAGLTALLCCSWTSLSSSSQLSLFVHILPRSRKQLEPFKAKPPPRCPPTVRRLLQS